MLVQHHPTLLDATCWPCLNTMLDDVGRCWLEFKLAQNFRPTSCNNVGFVWTGLILKYSVSCTYTKNTVSHYTCKTSAAKSCNKVVFKASWGCIRTSCWQLLRQVWNKFLLSLCYKVEKANTGSSLLLSQVAIKLLTTCYMQTCWHYQTYWNNLCGTTVGLISLNCCKMIFTISWKTCQQLDTSSANTS